MSEGVSRRSILKAAGVGGAGMAGLSAGGAVASAAWGGPLSPGSLGRLARVAEGVRQTDRAALGREEVLAIPAGPALASRLVGRRLSPGAGLEGLGLDIHQDVAEFLCDPRRPNLLLEGVERVTYEIVELAWQAGEGWPVYRQRSPHAEPAFGMRYAGVPRHQVVFLDDRAVYVGNPGTSGVIAGIRGPLRVDVNGDAHEAHRGFYKVLITGIS